MKLNIIISCAPAKFKILMPKIMNLAHSAMFGTADFEELN